MKRGNLIIISDENQILNPIFNEDITGKDTHNTGIEKFIKKYYTNTTIKIDLNDYNGAPCEIAKMDHLVIKTIVFKEMNGLSDILKKAKRKNNRKDEIHVR